MVVVMQIELGASDNERQSKGSLDLQPRDFPLRNAAAAFTAFRDSLLFRSFISLPHPPTWFYSFNFKRYFFFQRLVLISLHSMSFLSLYTIA